jgi:hypothetical protein
MVSNHRPLACEARPGRVLAERDGAASMRLRLVQSESERGDDATGALGAKQKPPDPWRRGVAERSSAARPCCGRVRRVQASGRRVGFRRQGRPIAELCFALAVLSLAVGFAWI